MAHVLLVKNILTVPLVEKGLFKGCEFVWIRFYVCVCFQGESKALREQLRQKEEQLQATQQQASMLSAELRDSSNARDRSMAELYRVKLEVDTLRQGQTDAQAECSRLEKQMEEMKNLAMQETVSCNLQWHFLNSYFTLKQPALRHVMWK